MAALDDVDTSGLLMQIDRLFEKYTVDVVPIPDLLKALEYVYDVVKRYGSFNVPEVCRQ